MKKYVSERLLRNCCSIALLLILTLTLHAQNSLYLAPGAPKKWVNLGDLDVSGDKITIEALITGISGGWLMNIISKHTDPTNVNYTLRPNEFLLTTSTGFYYISNPVFAYSLPLNKPFHIAVTYDGAELRYFVNGCLVASKACTGTLVNNDLNTAIGNQSTNNEPFTGYIDEVRIWNVARTQQEIQANMNTLPNPAAQTGLIAYYTFDSDYTNQQGNITHNGTPVNCTRAPNPYWTGNISNLSTSAVVTDNICYNGSAGAVIPSATGAFAPYSFWISGSGVTDSTIMTGLPAGNYTLFSKTSNAQLCIDSTAVTISQPSQIIINASQVFAPCDSVASAIAVASGGTGFEYSFAWSSSPVQNNDTANALTAGFYSIYATDSINCIDSTTFSVSITQPLALSLTPLLPSCPGECNGSAMASGSGGKGILSYLWETGQTAQWSANLCSDTIDLTLSDTNGCSLTEKILIAEAAPILTAVSVSNSNCGQPDGSATVTAVSGGQTAPIFGYLWDSSAANQATPAATGLTDGIYSVTVTSGLCDTTLDVTVGFNPPPEATAAGDSATCFELCNGTATVSASGGPAPWTFAYLWDNGDSLQTSTTLCDGLHSVTVTDSTGCSDTATVTIYQPALLVTTVDTSYFPCDSFATANAVTAGGTGEYFYYWSTSPVQNNDTAVNLVTGTYSLITVDENNCSDTDSVSVIITQPQSLSFIMVDPPCPGECNGSAFATASGGTPPYTYAWQSGQNTDTVGNLCAGSYPVSLNDSNGCTFSDTLDLSNADPVTTQVTTDNSNCGQPDGSATVSVISGGGVPGLYSYQWDTVAAGQTSPTATALANGTYYVTITSGFCDTVISASVGYNDPPVATASGNSTRCYGECNGTATASASGGPAPGTYSYSWDNGETTITAVSLCSDSHSVIITDSLGCKDTASIYIGQPDLLIAAVSGDGDTSICTAGTVSLSAAASGGTLPYTFTWSNGWSGAGPHSDNPADSTCYMFNVIDSSGCDTSSSFYCASIYQPISLNSINGDTICEGNTVTISASASGGHPDSTISFTWNTGKTDDSITVTPVTYPNPDFYLVTADDGCSPAVSKTITINYYQTPAVSFSVDTTSGCMPLTVYFQNTTADINSIQWNFSDGGSYTTTDPVHIFNDTGFYNVSVSVISTDNCPGDTTINNFIRVNALPPADAGNDTTVYQESTIELTASGGTQYLWDNGEETPAISVTPPYTTTYFVTVTNAEGCISFGEVTVTVDSVFVVFVPSIFSPNNDGNNDVVFLKGLGIREFRLQIFNRWGEKVFETADEKVGWDGTFNGTALNSGVFVYLLEVQMDDGNIISRGGNITLVR